MRIKMSRSSSQRWRFQHGK